ncbi:MAG: ATPase [Flavobacteriales bacterium]|jgi:glucosamine kinase
MIILIADSGSTKSDWLAIDEAGNELAKFSTMGFNPYFHSSSLVKKELSGQIEMMKIAPNVGQVFFYGAGSSSAEMCSIIEEGLKGVFSHASIHVGHDLNGAAYSTWSGEPAITCILGTGSNSCFFDGTEVYEEVPSLAYILGDEGSGSWFGKRLLRAFLYKKLPQNIHNDFVSEFGLSLTDVNKRLYTDPNPNVFLASFMKFISKHRDAKIVKAWLQDGFGSFLDSHVACFENHKQIPVHFIGSVAYHFSDDLQLACEKRGIQMGNLIKKPIEGLAKYHVECILQ